ncbi:helicase associated domain-containing protein [Arthrobacter crystallopoietes]|uniref:helicase associated domain-containing protein n=1 Tax=Crystallibacter crystallopoietes TaxID=37928 RepID=UPI003D658693
MAFAALKTYANREGPARVPTFHLEEDINLGSWVNTQRAQREDISGERAARLEAVPGWCWNTADLKWEAAFAALTAYVKREGHARVPTFHQEAAIRLGRWVSTQRGRREQMLPERRERLETLPGWVWRAN